MKVPMIPIKIKEIETNKFSVFLEQDEDSRFVIKYKRNSMENYAYLSFTDLNVANKVFDDTLINLEGH